MSLIDSRMDRVGACLRAYLRTNLPNYELMGHCRSPMDEAWHCTVRHKGGTILKLFIDIDENAVVTRSKHRWLDPEAHEIVHQGDLLEARKDRRAVRANECKGEFCESLKLFRIGQDKPHEFKKGLGPCGRVVVFLKFEDLGDKLRVYQFCEDEVAPDEFTYRTDTLSNWTMYRAKNPNPAKG